MLKFLNCFFFGVGASTVLDYGFGEEEQQFSGFGKFFDENIRPKGLLIEELRIRNLKKFMLYCRLSALALLLIWGTFYQLEQSNNFFSPKVLENLQGLALLLTGMAVLFPYSAIRQFGLDIKKNLYEEVFKFCKFDYYPEGSQRIFDYEPFNLTPNYQPSISTTEDLVMGQYKTVSFRLEELDLNIETGSGRRRRKVKTFRGVVIMMKFNKEFSGRTIVKHDLGMIGNFSRKLAENRLKDMEKVALEDPEFEKIFEVYSTDQTEARYLLTTSFMERLKNLSNFFSAKKIEASFYNDALLLQFTSRLNLFTVDSIFEPVNVAIESRKVLEQIGLIYDLIDELKLNENTGL